jgi:hypothetical protein
MNLVPLETIEEYKRLKDYYVSDVGEVFSKKKGYLCKLTPYYTNGYRCVYLYDIARRRKSVLVGRAVASAFLLNLSKGHNIRYKNGDRQDCRVENLEWIPNKWVKAKKRKKRTKVINGKEMHFYDNVYVTRDNTIVLNENLVNRLNDTYRAIRLKGNNAPCTIEFVTSLMNEAIDNYISTRGLKKIIYQMNNGLL